MIKQIEFTKMVASGNDFIVAETSNQKPVTRNPKLLAKQICDRKYGIGADGLLVLEESKIADIKVRFFNSDGSEPLMCGNGARCVALYSARNQKPETRNQIKIATKAGIIQAKVNKDRVKIKMTQPKDIKLDLPIKIVPQARPIKVNFIDTGVPHTVIFVEGLDKIDVADIGRQIRFHKKFQPQGTNVDFVSIVDDNNIKIRTYERGVEGETLACGTGAVAAALILATRYSLLATQITNVHTRSGEILRVGFNRVSGKFKDVWLEGRAKIIFRGVYYVK